MNYAKKVLKGTISVFVISIASAFIGYLVRLVLARGLTQEDYGIFYAVFTLFGLFAIFKNLGLSQAIAKFIPEYVHKKDYSGVKSVIISALSLQFIVSGIIVVAAFIFSDFIAEHFIHASSASIVIKILAVMFWIIPLEDGLRASFQGFQRMVYYSIIELCRMLAVLGLIVLLFWKDIGVLAPSIAYILAYFIVPIIFIPFFIKTFPQFFKAKLDITFKLLKKLINFGIPVMAGMVGGLILLYTDTLLITYFKGVKDVALYQVASPTSKLLLYLGYAFAIVFLPLSSELWIKGKKDKLKSGMELLYRYSFILVIPLVLLLVSFPELIMKILFGDNYIAAAPVVVVLSIGAMFYTIGHINGSVLSGIGMPKENTKIVLLAAVFNLVLNIILIPLYGIIGAAFSTLVSYIIILFLTSLKIKKHIKIIVPWAAWIKNALAGIVFISVIYFLKKWIEMNVWIEIFISVGVASIAYIALVFILKIITKEDLGFLKYAIGKRKA